MTVDIRVATATDEPRCLEMIETLTGETRTAGWAATSRSDTPGEYAQLEELIVDPAARGKNVGGLLVETAVERARTRGCPEFGLYLLEATEHNRPFYEKVGFEHVGSEMRQRL
jgi:GNAT superfamily N-acetyltransferase